MPAPVSFTSMVTSSVFKTGFQKYLFRSPLLICFARLFFNGIPRVDEQIDEDLFQPIRISKNGWEIFFKFLYHLYFSQLQLLIEDFKGLFQCLIYPDFLPLDIRFSAELPHMVDYSCEARSTWLSISSARVFRISSWIASFFRTFFMIKLLDVLITDSG